MPPARTETGTLASSIVAPEHATAPGLPADGTPSKRNHRQPDPADGAALRVDETIPALLKDAGGAPQSTIAAQLDLRTGDVIVEVNGTNVRNENEFAKALGWSLDPRMLSIRVLRNGKQVDLTLR